ncbi:MAG TPA: hypothetical protein VH599_16985 [Ktedonobacterales bacterium]
MVLVAPPSRRPSLRQGERSLSEPRRQQADVEPPGGPLGRAPSRRGAALQMATPDRWWNWLPLHAPAAWPNGPILAENRHLVPG